VFVVVGGQHPEGGVPADRVVERFDVLEDGLGELVPRRPGSPVVEFCLEDGEEAFGQGVVVGIADGAHRGQEARLTESVPESPRGGLAGVVGVVDAVVGTLAAPQGHLEGIDGQVGAAGPRGPSPAPGGSRRR
jgi:hypothetical protein